MSFAYQACQAAPGVHSVLTIQKKDADKPESIQKRTMKKIRRLDNLLCKLHLFILKNRRLKKLPILKGQLPEGQKFSSEAATWRGQGVAGVSCTKREFILIEERYFFTAKTIIHWNNLSRDIVESILLEIFKMQRDETFDNLIQAPFPTIR